MSSVAKQRSGVHEPDARQEAGPTVSSGKARPGQDPFVRFVRFDVGGEDRWALFRPTLPWAENIVPYVKAHPRRICFSDQVSGKRLRQYVDGY